MTLEEMETTCKKCKRNIQEVANENNITGFIAIDDVCMPCVNKQGGSPFIRTIRAKM